ncbi:hypothetical protein BN59_01088 [Legionella massiliensis]|uniref:Uncharacterized protein n=1 Tax=Legionella massiliensis TaxID=1034943 RepID=A0A078KX61_9GAMM|nr:hypothetical protein BN59_00627 [Legionella massiliensis]CDZ76646.1 hypothetical protein BN59_00920 [Legionella massiliensis]CDZ76812.1 hypothetical protein BN59_01088 [Legionella massiliensis]CEE12097.1 hypothetical protein BN1094_00627 [Legionella massiliensis]CEE12384.1 hypothetical protein BN1094_00920 [Legionella massiliensis]
MQSYIRFLISVINHSNPDSIRALSPHHVNDLENDLGLIQVLKELVLPILLSILSTFSNLQNKVTSCFTYIA